MKEVYIDVGRCLGCKSCELACAVAHSESQSLIGALFEAVPPRRRIDVIAVGQGSVPVKCCHCEKARCLAVCPTGALYRDEASGAVLHNSERCIGCGFCAFACPFGVITRLPGSKIAAKCDLCLDRQLPACVEACPTRALRYLTPEEAAKGKLQQAADLLAAGA
jgi:carbon-monoxide dehydrogenase iron sulfur subunit